VDQLTVFELIMVYWIYPVRRRGSIYQMMLNTIPC